MAPRSRVVDSSERRLSQAQSEIRLSELKKPKAADFETAIEATGNGKFHYLLFLFIIPASWAPSFDTSNMSMVIPSAECDLQLTLLHKGALNAAIYVGMVASALLWGYLADVKGRRCIIVYGYLADGICNILSGFSPNFATLIFFKFVSGFIVSGPYATGMSYYAEFFAAKHRPRILLFVGLSGAFGCIVNNAFAWLVIPQDWSFEFFNGALTYNSWRIFLSLCGVPTLIGVAGLFFFPESPKFLMSQGRNEEALKVFQTIYYINTGRPVDTYPINALENEKILSGEHQLPTQCPDTSQKKAGFREGIGQMKLIFLPPHGLRLLLFVSIQFCGLLTMNTFRLWQPQLFTILSEFNQEDHSDLGESLTFCEILDYSTFSEHNKTIAPVDQSSTCLKTIIHDEVYFQSILVMSSQIVSIFIASVFVNLLGHKKLLLISYVVALSCMLALNWSSCWLMTLVITCVFIGMMGTTLNVMIALAVSVFPTALRTMAVSLSMMVGRIGSIIGNLLFPVLLAYGCLSPLIALASSTLLCLILTCFVPRPPKDLK
ncbi:synaptic vesicle glycoprotein 2B-like [Prorops nasuta]|uniref:synaptic vesicle glycoprotein 2B-like n=1 Tax=Prorops nasuta TaxID=863751 RepID=UPI0034CEC6F6